MISTSNHVVFGIFYIQSHNKFVCSFFEVIFVINLYGDINIVACTETKESTANDVRGPQGEMACCYWALGTGFRSVRLGLPHPLRPAEPPGQRQREGEGEREQRELGKGEEQGAAPAAVPPAARGAGSAAALGAA